MKKSVWYLVLGVFLIGFIAVIWLHFPREVDVRLEGVKYRLGKENASEVEPAVIYIKGTVRRTLRGDRLFQGTVEIEGEPIPVPKDELKNYKFIAPKGKGFTISYFWTEDWKSWNSFMLGTLYANDDFSQITLAISEKREGGWSWNGGDGLMLTAPAKDRTEALQLANKLMEHILKDFSHLSNGEETIHESHHVMRFDQI